MAMSMAEQNPWSVITESGPGADAKEKQRWLRGWVYL